MDIIKTKLTEGEFDMMCNDLDIEVYSGKDIFESYEDYLDEIYDYWFFNGTRYYASVLLKEEDPIGYDKGFDEYTDNNYIEIELENSNYYIVSREYAEYFENADDLIKDLKEGE